MGKLLKKGKGTSKDITTEFVNSEDFEGVRNLVNELVADGDLSDEDVDEIIDAVDGLTERKQLTKAQRKEVLLLARDGVVANGKNSMPIPLRIWAVLSMVIAALLIPLLILLIIGLVALFVEGELTEGTTTEMLLTFLQVVLLGAVCVMHIIISVFLLKRRRHNAAITIYTLMAVTAIMIFNSIMTAGVDTETFVFVGVLAMQVALSSYLSPSLARERKLSHRLKKADTQQRAQDGTLGLDLEGSGYIKLDFFNLFWVFVIGCVLGLVVEVIFHMIVVDPGVYQDRAGLMWGPFSPIYGFGCVLMTIALNRFKHANIIIVFVVCTIIGGAFEYAVSWWMETAFGAIAWDYSNQFLNIQGRTCLLYASMFGVLGLAWIKLLLPGVLKLINKIPWKARYAVTAVCAALMFMNCAVTIEAMDCWYERVAGKPIVTDVQKFYAEYFDDDVMQNRFQSMSINPNGGYHS